MPRQGDGGGERMAELVIVSALGSSFAGTHSFTWVLFGLGQTDQQVPDRLRYLK